MTIRAAATAALVASVVAIGYGVLFLADNQFTRTFTTFLIAAVSLEWFRRHRRVDWWAAHAPLLAWGIIVLVPWGIAQQAGAWKILGAWNLAGTQVSLQLPRTGTFHLYALGGTIIGIFLALTRGSRDLPAAPKSIVAWTPLSLFLAGCVSLYLLGYLIAGRPISALWRLGGAVRYFDNVDASTALRILDYAPSVGSAALLVGSSVRRQHSRLPTLGEFCWLVIFLILAAGTGSRTKIYFVAVGWIIIQMSPIDPTTRRRRSTPKHLAFQALAGLVLLSTVVATAQAVSTLRSRGLGVVKGSLMDRALVDLDVVSTGEMMFIKGAHAGMLGGRSYSELPVLFLPRRIIGSDKPTNIAADGVMRTLVDANSGLAAPLWLEAALNYDKGGVFVYMLLLSFALVWLLSRGRSSRERSLGSVVARLGPLWILVAYLTLGRLTTFQMLLTNGTVLFGCFVGAKCIVETAPDSPSMRGLRPPPEPSFSAKRGTNVVPLKEAHFRWGRI